MFKRYDKRILSDALCELGETLGRPPTPKDLTLEMARKETYLRHFGSWEEALEYAGWTAADSKEPIVEEEIKIEFVNFLGSADIRFVNRKTGVETRAPTFSGWAKVSGDRVEQHVYDVEASLSDYISNIDVITKLPDDGQIKIVVVREDGTEQAFPEFRKKGVYLLVSKRVADAARRIGRTTTDLLYPVRYDRLEKAGDGGEPLWVISALGMINSDG